MRQKLICSKIQFTFYITLIIFQENKNRFMCQLQKIQQIRIKGFKSFVKMFKII